MTVSQLNMSWTVAPANARRNSSLSVDWANETIVFVSDVPMFTPMMIGIAGRTGNTTRLQQQQKSVTLGYDYHVPDAYTLCRWPLKVSKLKSLKIAKKWMENGNCREKNVPCPLRIYKYITCYYIFYTLLLLSLFVYRVNFLDLLQFRLGPQKCRTYKWPDALPVAKPTAS